MGVNITLPLPPPLKGGGKATLIQSNLFENIKGKFDTIIFNPPYLPQETQPRDITTEGGKKGYEVLERFLNDVRNYLKTNGIILIVFSSLTKKEKVNKVLFLNSNLFSKHFLLSLQLYLMKIHLFC